MGAVRFSKIVETVGQPSVHVLWMDPQKDTILQKAIKANRVMTIHQRSAGTKTDYGTIGFEKGVAGQILIFPKSLKEFSDQRVVGLKYDLLESASFPKSEQAPKSKPAKPTIRNKPNENRVTKLEPPVVEESAPGKMVKFPAPKVEDKDRPNEEVEEIKKQVRQAMKILEEGKQVAAFNLLKRIVE